MKLSGTWSILNGLITTLLVSRIALAIDLDISDKGMYHLLLYIRRYETT
jgi:hypothetical protein